MPLTTGKYAEYTPATRREAIRHRLFWIRHNIGTFLLEVRDGLSADTSAGGSYLCRDWGAWMVRPTYGFRSRRWISLPLRATRSISRDDRDRATDWFIDTVDI